MPEVGLIIPPTLRSKALAGSAPDKRGPSYGIRIEVNYASLRVSEIVYEAPSKTF